MPAVERECYSCGKVVLRYRETKTGRYFCSNDCKGDFQRTEEYINEMWTKERRRGLSEKLKGENNPNYGNRWDDELRQHVSSLVKERYKDEEYYAKFCEANRSRNWTEEGRRSIAEATSRRNRGVKKPPMSESTRKKIGEKSKSKFNRPRLTRRMSFSVIILCVNGIRSTMEAICFLVTHTALYRSKERGQWM